MTAPKWAKERAREIVEDQVSMTGYVGSNDWLRTRIAAALVEAEARGFESRMAAAEEFVRNEVKGRAEARAEGERSGREKGLTEGEIEAGRNFCKSVACSGACHLDVSRRIRALRGKP